MDAPTLTARLAAIVPAASVEPGPEVDQPTLHVLADDAALGVSVFIILYLGILPSRVLDLVAVSIGTIY